MGVVGCRGDFFLAWVWLASLPFDQDALQEFIDLSRWKNMDPDRAPDTLKLVWFKQPQMVHSKEYSWIGARREGYPDFSLLASVWRDWKKGD